MGYFSFVPIWHFTQIIDPVMAHFEVDHFGPRLTFDVGFNHKLNPLGLSKKGHYEKTPGFCSKNDDDFQRLAFCSRYLHVP
jgi:hypothetical protein